MMDVSDITRMANQIADFFAASGHDDAVKGVADHIRHFWDPRMRRALYAQVDKGGEGINPLVVDAAVALRQTDQSVASKT
jgi:formate dehydrogenase subunit delta